MGRPVAAAPARRLVAAEVRFLCSRVCGMTNPYVWYGTFISARCLVAVEVSF